jgi:hypothetical protein
MNTLKDSLMILIVIFFTATCIASEPNEPESLQSERSQAAEPESVKAEPVANIPESTHSLKDIDPDSIEYWLIRSQALTELVPFLTITRTEAKGHYNKLISYLEAKDMLRDFAQSGIKGSDSPAAYARAVGKADDFAEKNLSLPEKPRTWPEVLEWAMEYVVQEGYMPTDVSGDEELDMIKKICEQKEKYGRKVRDELRKVAQDCMDMKAYLDSKGQFDIFMKYVRYQKEQDTLARLARSRAGKDQLAAMERERREGQKYNIWQERQDRLSTRYYGDRIYRGGSSRYRYW